MIGNYKAQSGIMPGRTRIAAIQAVAAAVAFVSAIAGGDALAAQNNENVNLRDSSGTDRSAGHNAFLASKLSVSDTAVTNGGDDRNRRKTRKTRRSRSGRNEIGRRPTTKEEAASPAETETVEITVPLPDPNEPLPPVPAQRSIPSSSSPQFTADSGYGGFRPARVMRLPGLEKVIGADVSRLQQLFGSARLDVREGDVRKLQWVGTPCVLDVYLYPPQPGAEPTASYVDARRASDGLDVDRASCVAALSRR